MALFALAGFFVLAVVGGIGLNVAAADSADELARSGGFGFNEQTNSLTVSNQNSMLDVSESTIFFEKSVLSSPSSRNVTAGFKMIDDMEEAERQRIEAENAAAIARMEAEKAKQGVLSAPVSTSSKDSDGKDAEEEKFMEYSLPAVDWQVGHDAFIEEWSERIDAYLAGSPLSGYGKVFAQAAWDNGIDPRFSPAISNTESSKGSVCFRPHNAWGWGSSNWPDWETAIKAHVAGLASGYGYSITPEGAYKYCPGTHVDWYNKTLAQMALI